MRTTLLLMMLALGTTELAGQAPAPATPAPRQTPGTTPAPRPAQPAPQPAQPAQPAPRRPQPAVAARAGIAIQVTTPGGATIEGVRVELLGATPRNGVTNASGQVNFPGLQVGTYRLRFSGDEVTTFEREVTLRAGQIADLDVTLNEAPPPPPPPPVEVAPPPPPAAPAVGPAGQPQTLSVVDTIRRERLTEKDPRLESLLACSGNARTTLIQLNGALPERLYDTGEATYYVAGGEGTVRIDGRETLVETGGFVSVPRGTPHSFTRRGRQALVLLQTLSGSPCEQVK